VRQLHIGEGKDHALNLRNRESRESGELDSSTEQANVTNEVDRLAFSSLADKFWDQANALLSIAVGQTLIFLFALGTSSTLVSFVSCERLTWWVATILILAAFVFYSWLLSRYRIQEDQLRQNAGQRDILRKSARFAGRYRQVMVWGVFVVSLVAMILNHPSRHGVRCQTASATVDAIGATMPQMCPSGRHS